MIRVQRQRRDATGAWIQPNQDWFTEAQEATQRAVQEGPDHRVEEPLYRHQQVKMALEELFHQKCAYCEINLEGIEVEHFRPKGAVHEDPSHPGYYWLTYTWSNLYPSCAFCNQARIDYPTWGDRTRGPSAGKATQFPLENAATRARVPADDLKREVPLLLDPCEDDPSEHLGVNPFSGKMVRRSTKGETSIRVFNLNRKRICSLRVKVLKSLQEALDHGSPVEPYLGDEAQFAGACRALVADSTP